MGEAVRSITKDTLVPVGLLIVVVLFVWQAATDRQLALNQVANNTAAIADHTTRIADIETKLVGMDKKLDRIATAVGAEPEGE